MSNTKYLIPSIFVLAACTGLSREQRERDADIHYDLGVNALNARDSQTALKEFLAARDANPDFPEVHNALGLVYGSAMGRWADAEKELKTALELKPDYPEADNNLATVYMALQRCEEAMPLLRKAIENPLYAERPAAQVNLAICYAKRGDPSKAVGELKNVVVTNPKYCAAWKQLGTVYRDTGQCPLSLEAFGHFASECDKIAEAHLMLGLAQAKCGKPEDARDSFTRCKTIAKAEPLLSDECGRYLNDLGAP